jgi:hypothetical protein
VKSLNFQTLKRHIRRKMHKKEKGREGKRESCDDRPLVLSPFEA